MKPEPEINTQPEVSDEVRKTTCYMCVHVVVALMSI